MFSLKHFGKMPLVNHHFDNARRGYAGWKTILKPGGEFGDRRGPIIGARQ